MLRAFNHPITALREGLNAIVDGIVKPLPLNETHFKIEVENGLAIIRTVRVFSNNDERSIEAILTFPVAFDAVLTGLKAEIDGRKLSAHAKLKDAAREDYEEAVSKGKMAILHEEPLRGLHMLSVGQLGPGKTVYVETEMVMPLTTNGFSLYLRLPLVVGEIYGLSPFLPADDLHAVESLNLTATLTVSAQGGRVLFAEGCSVENGQTISLDRHLVLQFPDQFFGQRNGTDAWGRKVQITLEAPKKIDQSLDIAVLVDHSGSTGDALGQSQVHQSMIRGLADWSKTLRPEDQIKLWEFDDKVDFIGSTTGTGLAELISKLSPPNGGTELGKAIDAVMKSTPKPILVLTDGQTFSNEIRQAQEAGYPIHAILVGEGSLDAMIGHLAAQTGGQVIAVLRDDVVGALNAMLPVLRKGHIAIKGHMSNDRPKMVSTMRGGIVINVLWSDLKTSAESDAVGRYVASLAITLAEDDLAGQIAVTHGLSSHLTSLIIVDEVGEAINGLPRTIKIPVQASIANYSHGPIKEMMSLDLSEYMDGKIGTQNNYELKINKKISKPAPMFDIDWSLLRHDDLLNFTELPSMITIRINEMEKREDVKNLADSWGIKIQVVALLIIAYQDSAHDRNAGRFIRNCKKFYDGKLLFMIKNIADNLLA